jgi:hypothetical protein
MADYTADEVSIDTTDVDLDDKEADETNAQIVSE